MLDNDTAPVSQLLLFESTGEQMDLTETEKGSTWTWLDQLESLMKVIQGHAGKLSCMSPSVCSIQDSIFFSWPIVCFDPEGCSYF